VSAGVAVSADDGFAGLSESELGSDYVDDALVGRVYVEQLDAEFFAIFLQRFDLAGGDWIGDWSSAWLGGDIVIHRGDGALGLSDFSASPTQTVEGLRRCDLMYQVQIDVEQSWTAV
jgi:hypothetical protein